MTKKIMTTILGWFYDIDGRDINRLGHVKLNTSALSQPLRDEAIKMAKAKQMSKSMNKSMSKSEIEGMRTRIKELEQESKDNYSRGIMRGLSMYAWWKDGIQYVGTCGTTLKEAISRVNDA